MSDPAETLKVPHLQDVDPCAAARQEQSLPLADRLGCRLLPDSLWSTKFGQSVYSFFGPTPEEDQSS